MKLESKKVVPDGWKMVALGDVTQIVNGTTPKSSVSEFWGGDIVWITPTDLGKLQQKEIVNSDRTITHDGFNSCGLTVVPVGTVILSSRAPIGHLGIAKTDLCINQGCKALVPSEIIDSVFLYYVLKQSVPQLQELGSGATFAEVSKSQVEKFEIPLPPLPEQKRIAAILTERLAAVEPARKASEARLEAARALPAAYLREVFESEEARGWHKTRLGELIISSLRTGISKPEKFDSGKKCLTLSAVRNGSLLLDQVKSVDVTDSEAARNGLKAGVFYVVRGNGNRSLVGRGGIAPKQCDGVIFPDLLFEVNPNPNILLIEFLRWAWDSQSVRSQIEEKAKTAAGIYKINQQNLASIALPIPPLLIQKQVATVLSNKISKVADVQKMIFDELAIVGAMSASYLRQAFSGLL
ncbi:MAG: restriction endonuclease subunit S [Gammaproteobacteria bacterium]|nr:restriction endonuclease subunit S [Candidatus Competibacteraceae bacterium]MCP5421255.1 restriction endonuclease subunit S [Gammaproteobacteria bacterium]